LRVTISSMRRAYSLVSAPVFNGDCFFLTQLKTLGADVR
jgi:hypothetical protein